jgi:alpha-1,2-mannosyltransferase
MRRYGRSVNRLPPGYRTALLALALLAGLVVPSMWAASQERDGRDYASFYAATRVWVRGGDPYETDQLTALVRDEGVRRKPVYPFFYPPPALPLLSWNLMFGLKAGHMVMAGLNVGALVALGAVLVRWFAAPGWLIVALLVTSSGAVETARLGQVNGLVALLAVVGLWRGRGGLVAVAAVVKMSPALYLVRWLVQRRWRPVIVAVIVATLTLAACVPLVGAEPTRRFFFELLPSMGSGGWNGLDVPLSFRANHSLSGLLHSVFPGPDDQHLSSLTQGLSGAFTLFGVGALAWIGRQERDALGEALVWGGVTGVLVVTPAYTWEHHFVLLLLPMAAVGTALLRGRLPRWSWALFAVVWAVWAWRLPWWREALHAAPQLGWMIRESRLLMQMLLIGLCAWGALRSPLRGARVEGAGPLEGPEPLAEGTTTG